MEYAEDDQYTGQHINRNSRNNVIVFHKNAFGDELEKPRLKVDISGVFLSDISHVGNELESSKQVAPFCAPALAGNFGRFDCPMSKDRRSICIGCRRKARAPQGVTASAKELLNNVHENDNNK